VERSFFGEDIPIHQAGLFTPITAISKYRIQESFVVLDISMLVGLLKLEY